MDRRVSTTGHNIILLRHFALKALSDVLPNSKGDNEAFLSPTSPFNVVPLFELPVGNNIHSNTEWRKGGVLIVLFSEVTPFEDNVSKNCYQL